jgi:hypothetical protein
MHQKDQKAPKKKRIGRVDGLEMRRASPSHRHQPHQPTAALIKGEQAAPVQRLPARPPEFPKGAEGKLVTDGNPPVNLRRLVQTLGSFDRRNVAYVLGQATDTVPYGNHREIGNINFAAAELHAIGPRDGLETLLAVQMAGVHNIAMEFLRRAALKEQTSDGLDLNVSRATRLLRIFALQMEALKKYRSNGEQKVQVEHVHVHRGGQAIVGVNHRSRDVKQEQH